MKRFPLDRLLMPPPCVLFASTSFAQSNNGCTLKFTGKAPHSGFALFIFLISSRISRLMQGLPDFPALLFQRQYKRTLVAANQ
jgi:hypothetical protein